MSDSTFTDPKVIEMSRNFVNVIAHSETAHGDRDAMVGKRRSSSATSTATSPAPSTPRAGRPPSASSSRARSARPTTIFADPKGKEIGKAEGGLSARN
jgi:hypothetical protein